MTPEERDALAALLREARQRQGPSARELALRAGVDVGTISLLERSKIAQPRLETVRAIAQCLGIPLSDVYTLVHWLPARELPSLRPYMRAMYADLPDEPKADDREGERGRQAQDHAASVPRGSRPARGHVDR